MKGNARRRKQKKELWKDLLKKKWEDVNKVPKRKPISQFKTIA